MKIFNFFKTEKTYPSNEQNEYTNFKNSQEETSHSPIIANGVDEYVKYNQDLLAFPNKEIQEMDAIEYINAIKSIVNYLQSFYQNKTDNELIPEINVDEMSQGIPRLIIHLLSSPSVNDIVYIIDDMNSAHFHVNNNIVEMAENLCTLPGLNYEVRTIDLDDIFTGLTIFQARALLSQMNVLPPKNNLDQQINSYFQRVKLHHLIIKDIVSTLLISPNDENYKIAQIFISYFEPDFKLPPYKSPLEESPKKLTYPNSSQNCSQ